MRTIMMTALVALVAGTAGAHQFKPPIAPTKPHVVKAPFGAQRNDEYYWLRDDTRKNPEMLAYLNAENQYADLVLKPLQPLAAKLYEETIGHIKQDDSSVPYRHNGYWYATRYTTGADYPVMVRRKGTADGPEEILFDQPAMAKGKGYFSIGNVAVSPDNRTIAWPRIRSGGVSTS